ncbi:MAG: hypothetical protein NTX75_02510 [Proteobacteria bacterium]|nr:hypothetical protein [Pseudomonadota bacterium]
MKTFSRNKLLWHIELRISVVIIFLIIFLSTFANAITIEYKEAKTIPLYETFKTKEKWHATAYDIKDVEKLYEYCGKNPDKCKDENNLPPAMKLCFWHDKNNQICHRVEDRVDSKDSGSFQTVQTMKIVELCKSCKYKYGLMVLAQNWGFASGHLDALSIWTYAKNENKFINNFPSVRFSEQTEYKIFSSNKELRESVVVIARAIWNLEDKNETRYSPHKFEITIHRLKKNGYYQRIGTYVTKKKYPSYDDVDKIDVITPEIENIKLFITAKSMMN